MGWKKQARKGKTQSTTFDLLEKRHHVRSYIRGKIPPKEHVESALKLIRIEANEKDVTSKVTIN